ncbi:formylglycine-generating enzyme family protein [Cryobacterium sp. MLB-32]|uniref:formylglycine-generating enzyme family protein n=1 Tax=Cryobacterium sp. MLB-32 TaxID=1529318 RepID=UPI0009DDC1E0
MTTTGDHGNSAEAKASCCSPSLLRDGGLRTESAVVTPPSRGAERHAIEQAAVPAQYFLMGDSTDAGNPGDGEGPAHEVWVDAFQIDATTVTNSAFARFVAESGYRTEAETFGYSAVFHLALAADPEDVLGQPPQIPWWLGVRGADWQHPGGPLSTLDGRGEHPAVHVSWSDAAAYCVWAGRRLPTEAEWECASRGGLRGKVFPWGNDWGDRFRCNTWQGVFPTLNTVDDGWLTTAPVREYSPNPYGLWQSVGNVWEWCSDWWDEDYYAQSPVRNPTGPRDGAQRAMRGGSFLCHDSYCNRYRNSARASNTPDSSAANIGFRTVGMM